MEFELLKNTIAEVLNVDPAEITRETTFEDDLGADSLDVFQIILGIEEALKLEVDQDALEEVRTVGDAEELIKNTVEK